MITKINHIGIAVKSLDDTIPLYRDILGLKLEHIEEIEDQKVKVAMFSVGEVHIELLEPTSPDSNIAKYLEKKGPGIHHIAFQTDDIENNIQKIQDNNLQMIDVAEQTTQKSLLFTPNPPIVFSWNSVNVQNNSTAFS